VVRAISIPASREHDQEVLTSLKMKGAENMQMVTCPLCNADFELPENAREGDIVVCPVCAAELKLIKEHGRFTAVAV
jgi:lysine biosynthesis protein LysW